MVQEALQAVVQGHGSDGDDTPIVIAPRACTAHRGHHFP